MLIKYLFLNVCVCVCVVTLMYGTRDSFVFGNNILSS